MRKIILSILLSFCFIANSFAYDINESVLLESLSDGASCNTIILTGLEWVTCNTALVGNRKVINILNTSLTETVYLSPSSGSTSTISRRLYPQQDVTFRCSSEGYWYSGINIYASSNTGGVVIEIWEMR